VSWAVNPLISDGALWPFWKIAAAAAHCTRHKTFAFAFSHAPNEWAIGKPVAAFKFQKTKNFKVSLPPRFFITTNICFFCDSFYVVI